MNQKVVKLEGVSFTYRIRHGAANSLKQTFINLVKGIDSDIKISALHNINFELGRGEILGIIGKNGSGKSTLLKVIAGILPPSAGLIEVSGSVAPLIELGAGFNPELTGAENIELFGVLLGEDRKTMQRDLQSISDWAALTHVINLPIRTYSTGMLSRLGFSVATHRSCDLLIIDEVLSVGDGEFQLKSLIRIDELMRAGEATILVSHDLNLIQERATKVLWLQGGQQIMLGNPKEVIDAYRQT
jgi:ABC-type polysaccharide/polyol phosphate transport system ATPase subunit